MTRLYVLTEAAEADLRGIIRYTLAQWGGERVRDYVARLSHGFERISSGDGAANDLSTLYPALRMLRCEHHYIFGLLRDDAPALIVAILHERMDLITRVAHRLA